MVEVCDGLRGEKVATSEKMEPLDATTHLQWPDGSTDSKFEHFLDEVGLELNQKPSVIEASVGLDEIQTKRDSEYVSEYEDVREGLRRLVELRQQESEDSRLNGRRVKGFEGFPRFKELRDLAEYGAKPHFCEEFQSNGGVGDFLRPQYQQLRAIILHTYGKLHRRGWCIILPKVRVEGMAGLHVSPTHVACKRGDTKGRCCIDHRASGLNDGTDMDAVEELLGEMKLPGLHQLAKLLHDAWVCGSRELFKADVSSAFHRVKLSFEAVLSQSTQIDDLILFPLVAVFGWKASPIYYSLVSEAVDWAHNGGIDGSMLDYWRQKQGKVVRPRGRFIRVKGSSLTYVDDTVGPVRPGDAGVDIDDVNTIICQLLGPEGVNVEKDERGPVLTALGWHVDMLQGIIRPADRGIMKMIWWLFRKVTPTTKSLRLSDLQTLVSLLRWYSAVMPLAYGATRALNHTLGNALRSQQYGWVHLDGAAKRELIFWRWLLDIGLRRPALWSAPMWFLAVVVLDREVVEVFTDACTLIGGGYVKGDSTFGQFRWSEEEKVLFATTDWDKTDINVLEFVVAVVGVVMEREALRGKVVLLRVDNTSAVSWLNNLRLGHMWGQAWVRLLIIVSLMYDIRIVSTHVKGVDNPVADGLSRYFQETRSRLLQNGFAQTRAPSWAWRQQLWMLSGTKPLVEEWLEILERPTQLGSTL